MIARAGHALPSPRSLLDVGAMEELGQELVRLCDGISIYGLVDYQMGVAEEEILECECISNLDYLIMCGAPGLTRSEI